MGMDPMLNEKGSRTAAFGLGVYRVQDPDATQCRGDYFLTVPAVRAKRARNFSTRPVSTMRVWAPV